MRVNALQVERRFRLHNDYVYNNKEIRVKKKKNILDKSIIKQNNNITNNNNNNNKINE